MESVQLSKRLEQVASYIPENARLADIGSDHAYLPCALVQRKAISYAVAGEVVKGPFEKALNEVNIRNLEAFIDVRYGDGVEVIQSDDQISAISICGMGGALIRDILDRGFSQKKLSRTETLILQPNVGEKTLRTFLMNQRYKIVAEEIVEENDKIYEIIVAEPSDDKITYTDQELTFGPLQLASKSAVFKKKWLREIDKLQYILSQLNKSAQPDTVKQDKINHEINTIKETIQ